MRFSRGLSLFCPAEYPPRCNYKFAKITKSVAIFIRRAAKIGKNSGFFYDFNENEIGYADGIGEGECIYKRVYI